MWWFGLCFLMMLPLLNKQAFVSGCIVLCLKLKKVMHRLKENAAAALKLSILYWSVQYYIFIIVNNKTHQQINRLIVSWFSQVIFRLFLLILSNSPCTETRSIPAYVSQKVSWKLLFIGGFCFKFFRIKHNEIMFCLLVWLFWRHKLCRCHLWSETLIMTSCKFKLETVSEIAGFQWKLF